MERSGTAGAAVEADAVTRFDAFVTRVEPGLRRSLVASYGVTVGADAAHDAVAWAWEHFDRLEPMANPAGYLYRVGQTAARRALRRRGREASWDAGPAGAATVDRLDLEPGLLPALAALSVRQRTSVLLVHGYGHTLAEAAALQGCRVSTVRNHLSRGLARLRTALGVTVDG